MNTSLYEPEVQKILDGRDVSFYPSPQDWRDQWIYFLLVDRFNNPAKPPTPNEFPCDVYQGGNLEGIIRQLPYIKKLGAGALWLSPVLYNAGWFNNYWGGYGIQNFLRIEPRFCSDPRQAELNPDIADKEFRKLVDEAHKNGIYIILDIVLNHSGDLFNYDGMRDAAPWNEHGEYDIYWRDSNGVARGPWKDISKINNLPLDAGIYPRELQHNDFFRRRGSIDPNDLTRGDFDRLKELVTEYKYTDTNIYPVRNILIRSYQYLIAKFDIDGLRIDTLQYIEPEFARVFGNAMREFALSIGKKNFFTFGEIWQDDDESKIASFIGRDTERAGEFIGIDAAINFPMRKRLYYVCKGYMPPSELAKHYDYQRETLKKIISSHGDASSYYVNFCDNHDLNNRFHNPQYPGQTKIMLTCLMTLSGIPCIYYGTEQGLSGTGDRREYSREALWSRHQFDDQNEFYELIKKLSDIRNQYPPLKYGRQYFRQCSENGVDFGYSSEKGGIISFSRILNDREILIAANTDTDHLKNVYVVVDDNLNPHGRTWRAVYASAKNLPQSVPTTIRNHYHVVKIKLQPMEAQIWV